MNLVRIVMSGASALLAVVWLAGTCDAATVTVGSPLTRAFTPTPFTEVGTAANTVLPEPGAQAASPISGTVVRWRVLGAEGGPFRLRVLRPAGGISYRGAGTSTPGIPAGLTTQTFTAALPIEAGDLIGLDNTNGADKLGLIAPLEGTRPMAWLPPLADGVTLAPTIMLADAGEFSFNADVQPPPTVLSIKPRAGSIKGRTKVKIAGTDLTGATAVSFGGRRAASFAVDSEARITALSPPARKPGRVNVAVRTPAGQTSAGAGGRFTYRACIVPRLRGRTLKGARRVLRRRKCRLGKVKRRRRSGARGATIVRQRPRPHAVRAPGARVGVTLILPR